MNMFNSDLKIPWALSAFIALGFGMCTAYGLDTNESAPRIHVSQRIISEKAVDVDKIILKIPIENIGKESLIINKINASCGCIKISLPPDVIYPGERVEIEATIEENRQGTQWRFVKLNILSNDPILPIIPVSLEAIFQKSVVIIPNEIHFGNVYAFQKSELIPFQIMSTRQLKITEWKTNNKHVVISINKYLKKNLFNGVEEFWIEGTAQMLESHPAGPVTGEIVFTMDSDKFKTLILPLSGLKERMIKFSPSCILLDSDSPENNTTTIEFKTYDGREIKFSKLSFPLWLEAESHHVKPNLIQVGLRFLKGEKITTGRDKLQIHFESPILECVEVPIYVVKNINGAMEKKMSERR